MEKTGNHYEKMDWAFMLNQYSRITDFNISEYYKILSPEFPDFLDEYISVPSMQRLAGVGLLCGSDWSALFNNRFYYSRLDHSIGVALIVWNFTKDKIQTLAGLFHDISTPCFSHVADFRNGDALTQTSTENETELTILSDSKLCQLLKRDNIAISQVSDYHIYSIADNERPQLSADRLEYMFPSGAALQASWNLSEIKEIYSHITVLTDENGLPEVGFDSLSAAEIYTEKFLETGHMLQLNEDKLSLQLLADLCSSAEQLGLCTAKDFYSCTEKELLEKMEKSNDRNFLSLLKTFRTMTSVLHTEKALDGYYSVSLKVKQRFINPLVKDSSTCGKAIRVFDASAKARKMIQDFLDFQDTQYGCVKISD